MGAVWELPGYELEQLVGFGGGGEVWRARERASGDVVAVKRLHACDAVARERLRREAAVLASVAGEHVVRLRDVVLTATEAALVMDFAAGGSLATVLAVRGRLAGPEVVTLVGPLAAALADAHDRGLVHGDVTPANILFTDDGRPLLADFGVARVVGNAAPTSAVLAGAGLPVEGTVPYVAPEVLAGAAPTPAADVFSLCRLARDALAPESAPAALGQAIDAGLADDPHDRPAARELAMDVLRSCAAAPVGLVRSAAPVTTVVTAPVVSRPAEPPTGGPDDRRRDRTPWHRRVQVPRRLVASAAASAVLVLAIAGGVMWGHRSQPSAAVLPSPPAAEQSRPAAPAPALPAAAPAPSWRAVIAHLDALRARAFGSLDIRALAALYAPGAGAYAADLVTLHGLARRGLHVRGFVIRPVTVAAAGTGAATAVLHVTDTISGYTLVDGSGRTVVSVAARSARSWMVELARVAGSWRIATVTPAMR